MPKRIFPRLVVALCMLIWAGSGARADDSAANRLFMQAYRAWQQAETLPAAAPERAALLAMVARNLNGIVEGHPESTLAVLLMVGDSIGPLSLAAVAAAVAAAPDHDAACTGDPCFIPRLEAFVQATAGEVAQDQLRAQLMRMLLRAGRADRAQVWLEAEGDETQRSFMLLGAAWGAAQAGDAEAALAYAAEVHEQYRRFAVNRIPLYLARQGSFAEALAVLERIDDPKERQRAEAGFIQAEIEAGLLAEAEAQVSAMTPGAVRDAAEAAIAHARLTQLLATPGADLDAALTLARSVPSRPLRGEALGQVAAALALAGRFDEARAVAQGPDADGLVELAMAQALDRAGRRAEAMQALNLITDRYRRERARIDLRRRQTVDAGLDALLAEIADRPLSDEMLNELLSLARLAAGEGDIRMARGLMVELMRGLLDRSAENREILLRFIAVEFEPL